MFFPDLAQEQVSKTEVIKVVQNLLEIEWIFDIKDEGFEAANLFSKQSQIEEATDEFITVVSPSGKKYSFIPISIKPEVGRYVFKITGLEDKDEVVLKFLSHGLLATDPAARYELLAQNLPTVIESQPSAFPKIYAFARSKSDDSVTQPVLMLTEYVDGTTLSDWVESNQRKQSRLEQDFILRSLEIVAGILKGLQALHRNGLYYQDLALSNVIISLQENAESPIRVVLVDLDPIAPQGDSENPFHSISSGTVMLRVEKERIVESCYPIEYLAERSIKADISAVGVILLKMLGLREAEGILSVDTYKSLASQLPKKLGQGRRFGRSLAIFIQRTFNQVKEGGYVTPEEALEDCERLYETIKTSPTRKSILDSITEPITRWSYGNRQSRLMRMNPDQLISRLGDYSLQTVTSQTQAEKLEENCIPLLERIITIDTMDQQQIEWLGFALNMLFTNHSQNLRFSSGNLSQRIVQLCSKFGLPLLKKFGVRFLAELHKNPQFKKYVQQVWLDMVLSGDQELVSFALSCLPTVPHVERIKLLRQLFFRTPNSPDFTESVFLAFLNLVTSKENSDQTDGALSEEEHSLLFKIFTVHTLGSGLTSKTGKHVLDVIIGQKTNMPDYWQLAPFLLAVTYSKNDLSVAKNDNGRTALKATLIDCLLNRDWIPQFFDVSWMTIAEQARLMFDSLLFIEQLRKQAPYTFSDNQSRFESLVFRTILLMVEHNLTDVIPDRAPREFMKWFLEGLHRDQVRSVELKQQVVNAFCRDSFLTAVAITNPESIKVIFDYLPVCNAELVDRFFDNLENVYAKLSDKDKRKCIVELLKKHTENYPRQILRLAGKVAVYIDSIDLEYILRNTLDRAVGLTETEDSDSQEALSSVFETVCLHAYSFKDQGVFESERLFRILQALPAELFLQWDPRATARLLSNLYTIANTSLNDYPKFVQLAFIAIALRSFYSDSASITISLLNSEFTFSDLVGIARGATEHQLSEFIGHALSYLQTFGVLADINLEEFRNHRSVTLVFKLMGFKSCFFATMVSALLLVAADSSAVRSKINSLDSACKRRLLHAVLFVLWDITNNTRSSKGIRATGEHEFHADIKHLYLLAQNLLTELQQANQNYELNLQFETDAFKEITTIAKQ